MQHPSEAMRAAVLERATGIAKSIGAIDYLDGRAKEIGRLLAERDTLPERINVREKGRRGLVPYTVRRWTVNPGVRRHVNTTKLKADYPHAYRVVVTETDPERVYQVRLDASRGGVKSTEWAALKESGAAVWQAQLQEKYEGAQWGTSTYLDALHFLRATLSAHKEKLEQRKDELVAFVVEHELPLAVPGHADGRVVLRENGKRKQVDYDLLEKRFPDAATLITRTAQPGGVRIGFYEYVPDTEEGDEEEVRGIWK